MEKYLPPIIGVVLVIGLITTAFSIPEGFGPPLTSQLGFAGFVGLPEMFVIMIGIVAVGAVIAIYGLFKVLRPYQGQIAQAFAFILGGIILFVGVTVLDIPIHTGDIGFNRLTHFIWHFLELIGLVFLGMGFKKLADLFSSTSAPRQ
jgi:hypothetical protein